MGFRVTNSMLIDTSLRNLGKNVSRMNDLQTQMGSQKRINRLSDDPLGMITSLQARSRMLVMEQHMQNLDDTDSWLQSVEANLMDMNKIITTIYADTIDAATDVKTAADRAAIAQKVREFRDQLVQNGNNTILDKYVFGGYNGTTAPFEVKDGVLYYNGFNMYASDDTRLNPEQGTADALGALTAATSAGPYTTAQEVLGDATAAQSATDAILDVVLQIAASRTIPDNTGSPKKPDAQDALDAANDALAYFSAKQGWSPEQTAAAQTAIDSLQAAFDAGGDLAKLEENAKVMSSAMQGVVDGLTAQINAGRIASPADAQAYIAGAQQTADDAALKAVQAASPGGIAYEAKRKYEVEIGLGQFMNITMNGVEVFGTGENNLYKILDDLYNALIKEFNDPSYGEDAYAAKAVKAMEDMVLGLNPADALGDTQTAVNDLAAAVTNVISAGLGTDGSNVSTVLQNMRDAAEGLTGDARTVADALIKQVEYAHEGNMGKEAVSSGLTAALDAINAFAAGLSSDPLLITTADAQAAATTLREDYDNALKFSSKGKKTGSVADDITPFISKLQGKQKDMMASLAIVGGRVNRVQIVRERYELDAINYTERISKVEDADITEVIMYLKMAESVYNASLSSSARIIQPTLMDFLR